MKKVFFAIVVLWAVLTVAAIPYKVQAAPSDYYDTVQKTYIGYYQRAADPGGLIYWAGRLNASGRNLTGIIEAFANSAESQALYGTIDSNNIFTVVNGIYNALFGRNAEAEGRNYYVNGFKSGQFTAATIMLNVLYGAQNEDLWSVNNKVTAANLFTRTIDPELDGANFLATYSGNTDAQKARDFLSAITFDPGTIPTQAEVTAYIQDDIADPGDPIGGGNSLETQLIGSYPQLSNHYGADIFVSGNYAYFCEKHVSWTDTYVRILDITTPSAPSLAGSYYVGGLISAIYVANGYMYLGLNNVLNEFQTVSVANPAAPSLTAKDTYVWPDDIAVSGSYLYAVGDDWGSAPDWIIRDFTSFSLSNPAVPSRAGGYNDNSQYYIELAVQSNYAYIAGSDNGLVVFNISNPAVPSYAGGYNSSVFRGYLGVSVSGNYAAVMNFEYDIEILDISNLTSISKVGKYTPTPWSLANDFVLIGNYLYVAEGTNGLKIIDISNPASPVVAGYYKPSGTDPNSLKVFVNGQDVYVADGVYGLMIIRVTP